MTAQKGRTHDCKRPLLITKKTLASRGPSTHEAALPPTLGRQRDFEPFLGDTEPRFRVERANRLGCRLSAFLSLLGQRNFIVVGDNGEIMRSELKVQAGPEDTPRARQSRFAIRALTGS